MLEPRSEIRLALPSKGVLAEEALSLLASAGLRVHKPNPRQYKAIIPSLPGLTVLFQRPGDIVVSVRDGSVDFGVTGWDIFSERRCGNSEMVVMQQDLHIGACTLNVIVPEANAETQTMADLKDWEARLGRPLHAATKFPELARAFFNEHNLPEVQLISAEGTLEIAPTIGYADLIVDLISTGTTLRDNRLKTISDGLVLRSQGCLIANRSALKSRPEVLASARNLLEFLIAYLRGSENLAIFANVRGDSPEDVAHKMFQQALIGGLQGPTISQVITRDASQGWYAAHIIVRKDQLAQAIAELRAIGGSGVVVSPVAYIFEEEPEAYRQMLAALAD
jgi:ATP phosphoribosyltransferase